MGDCICCGRHGAPRLNHLGLHGAEITRNIGISQDQSICGQCLHAIDWYMDQEKKHGQRDSDKSKSP